MRSLGGQNVRWLDGKDSKDLEGGVGGKKRRIRGVGGKTRFSFVVSVVLGFHLIYSPFVLW